MKKHNCLAKRCSSFAALPDAPYWAEQRRKERNRQKVREQKKEKKAQQLLQQEQTQALLNDITEYADWLIWIYDFPLEITSVIQYRDGENINYIIHYVSERPQPDSKDFCYLHFLVQKRFAQFANCIELRHLRLPDGRYAVFDDWYG